MLKLFGEEFLQVDFLKCGFLDFLVYYIQNTIYCDCTIRILWKLVAICSGKGMGGVGNC